MTTYNWELREVVVAIVVATARCTPVATFTE
jgi:hypothetical protein